MKVIKWPFVFYWQELDTENFRPRRIGFFIQRAFGYEKGFVFTISFWLYEFVITYKIPY